MSEHNPDIVQCLVCKQLRCISCKHLCPQCDSNHYEAYEPVKGV